MIKRLWVGNFGPYEKAEIDLPRLVAIFGPNGSGKSMVFNALRAIGRVARFPMRQHSDEYLGGFPTRLGQVAFEDLVHRRDQSRTLTLGVAFESPDLSGTYEVQLVASDVPAGRIVKETLKVRTASGEIAIQADEKQATSSRGDPSSFRLPRNQSIPILLFRSQVPEDHVLGTSLQELLWSRVGVFRFDPTMLKLPAEVGETLSPNGRNLASYLDGIRNGENGRQRFDEMLASFRTICPHVRDIVLPIERTNEGPRQRISLLMEQSSQQIPAALESDGTLLMLAYAASLRKKLARGPLHRGTRERVASKSHRAVGKDLQRPLVHEPSPS